MRGNVFSLLLWLQRILEAEGSIVIESAFKGWMVLTWGEMIIARVISMFSSVSEESGNGELVLLVYNESH
jgi:hypothetical protein